MIDKKFVKSKWLRTLVREQVYCIYKVLDGTGNRANIHEG